MIVNDFFMLGLVAPEVEAGRSNFKSRLRLRNPIWKKEKRGLVYLLCIHETHSPISSTTK